MLRLKAVSPLFKRTFLYLFNILLLSETKTSYPFRFPKIAVPTPLSPPPKITNLFIYLNFKVTIAKTAKRIPTIQKRTTILLS